MKRILALSSILCLSVLGCAKEPPLTGAYSAAVVGDQDVQAAANFAVQAANEAARKTAGGKGSSTTLIKVTSAEKQVVAGLNYRLTLLVNVNGTQRTAEAVVWQQAWRKPNPYELTFWNLK